MADGDIELMTASEAPVELANGSEAQAAADPTATDSLVPDEIPPAGGEHKRKLEDLGTHTDEAPLKKQEIAGETPASADEEAAVGDGEHVSDEALNDPKLTDVESSEIKGDEFAAGDSTSLDGKNDGEQPSLGGEIDGSGATEFQKLENQQMGNGELPPPENAGDASAPLAETEQTSRNIEVPNSKVGVLIGKAGDTIKYLQYNSGARIQITRDADADPHSENRKVELIGNPEQINKAEKLIKDVIAEADAGGSPALVARGFSIVHSGADQIEISVPNEKVGLIIGKGGETIKNMQMRTGARIQLIPQHLPEGDSSKERIVRVTGNKKQIESAKELIKDAMNQIPIKPSPLSGGYSQQGSRPRGTAMTQQWGGRQAGPPQHKIGYDYQQSGMYPQPQASRYPQPYGGYSQQPPPRSSFPASWDQRAPVHNTSGTGGYDYYGQGGPSSANQPSHPMPNPNYASNTGNMNYNYGHSQGPGYGQQTSYAQPTSAQQNYGQSYNEPKYDNQGPNQQYYGQQPMNMQSGGAPQSAYGQSQSYSKPTYGAPQEVPPSYGPPRVNQPGDHMYQGSGPSYASNAPTQQQPYPYGPGAQGPGYNETYGAAPGTMDGYTQPSGGYSQQGAQTAPVYGQGAHAVPAYNQPNSQPGSYGQYPTSQPGYVDPSSGNMNYAYQGGPADNGYGNTMQPAGYGAQPSSAGTQMPPAVYGAQPSASGQSGYAQPVASNPSGYYEQQPVPAQAGYSAGHPGSAPAGYTKSLSPQPTAYGG